MRREDTVNLISFKTSRAAQCRAADHLGSPRPDILRFPSFLVATGGSWGLKVSSHSGYFPLWRRLEPLNSSPDRLNSIDASLRAWPVSAQKVLLGIGVLHVT